MTPVEGVDAEFGQGYSVQPGRILPVQRSTTLDNTGITPVDGVETEFGHGCHVGLSQFLSARHPTTQKLPRDPVQEVVSLVFCMLHASQ